MVLKHADLLIFYVLYNFKFGFWTKQANLKMSHWGLITVMLLATFFPNIYILKNLSRKNKFLVAAQFSVLSLFLPSQSFEFSNRTPETIHFYEAF